MIRSPDSNDNLLSWWTERHPARVLISTRQCNEVCVPVPNPHSTADSQRGGNNQLFVQPGSRALVPIVIRTGWVPCTVSELNAPADPPIGAMVPNLEAFGGLRARPNLTVELPTLFSFLFLDAWNSNQPPRSTS